MRVVDARLSSIVGRVASVVAVSVALTLPLGFWAVAHYNLSRQLQFKARVKATALQERTVSNPDTWMFAENHLQGLLAHKPVPLEDESASVHDEKGNLVTMAGEVPAWPVLRRSYPIHDIGRIAGRVELVGSYLAVVQGTALAAILGGLLGAAIFMALRILPLRALQRVTNALFEQKQRAEVTLRSIGDAVVTTDAATRVEFMNAVAERLTGWSLAQAFDRPIAEVVPIVDADSGEACEVPLARAFTEGGNVSLDLEVDLVRRDGSRVAISDSAAPIRDADGVIVGGVLIFRDVSLAREAARRRSWEATHDPLTGLVNRREFESLMSASVATARSAGKHHVVCYMDLDQFKVINDTFGHTAGDDLLKALSGVFQSRIRASDTLARLGGDEFGLLLEGCSLARAKFIAADLLAAVVDFRFNRDGKVLTLGVSIGLAEITGDTASSAEALSRSDIACYWAKEQGRNRVCVYRDGDSEMATRRREMSWIARINAALAEDRFVLYHQSYLQLNAAAGAHRHLEVLLRMVDEAGELVQPGSFMPAAERYNLMPAIDRWVIGRVFAGYGRLVEMHGGGPLTCAINLSGTSLNAEGLLDFIRQRAAAHALPPRSICFEITETAAINNLRSASEFIGACKALGFLFALDDFGTGTSSFGYLKNLPVDYLKIDGGFVKNLRSDPIDKAMTETINRIGHIMGIKTVAEYAENSAIIEDLKDIGVDYAQGFGVCLPTPLFPIEEPLQLAAIGARAPA